MAVGSFEGYLRVYHPQTRDYLAQDMILERNMSLPILQVEGGHFSPQHEGKQCLAILHSRKLVLCLLTKADQHVTYTLLCEHSIDRNAYNMVQGSFGGPGRCILCV